MQKPLILVVEDNEIQRKVIRLLAGEFGYNAVLAETSAEACVAYSTGEDFKVVLMDIRLPDEDGVTCTSRLRAIDAGRIWAPIPIIAMTGYVSMNDRERCIQNGFDDCLIKPFSSKEFREILAKWVTASDSNVMPIRPRKNTEQSSK